MARKSEKEKAKYRHITVRRLWEMKEEFMAEQEKMGSVAGALGSKKDQKVTMFVGSKWVGEFIKFVVANKNQHENA